MKKAFSLFSIGLLLALGCGLLYLTNTGVLSFDEPYARQLANSIPVTQRVVAFVNVNVIPMDSARIMEDQTVVVRDGVIDQIGDSQRVSVPPEAQVIDGRGRYLMPGLVDMHVHVLEENELLLYVANGVTTVRNLWGGMNFADHLAWRTKIEQGELFGPMLYTSGPVMEGPPKTMPLMELYETPESAVEAVSRQIEQGYDFIKVYDHIDRPTYDAIVRTAHAQGVMVVGHTPKKVGLDAVLASGQTTIEHLSGFIDSDAAGYIIPEAELARYAELTREAGAFVCPTIAVYQMHVAGEDLHLLEDRPEMAYVSPIMRFTWRYLSRPGSMGNITYGGDYPARIHDLFIKTTRILHEHEVQFVLGTDADNPYVAPGFSLLDELDYLVEAGFSPYEAIEAGTRRAAEAMDKLDEFGTVEAGKRADLLLLEQNPLADVTQVRRPAGVMLRGQWLPEPQLQALLAALVDSYQPALVERLWPLTLIGAALYLVWRKAR